MAHPNAKDRLPHAADHRPGGAAREDATEHVPFLVQVGFAKEQLAAGRTGDHIEVKRRLAR